MKILTNEAGGKVYMPGNDVEFETNDEACHFFLTIKKKFTLLEKLEVKKIGCLVCGANPFSACFNLQKGYHTGLPSLTAYSKDIITVA